MTSKRMGSKRQGGATTAPASLTRRQVTGLAVSVAASALLPAPVLARADASSVSASDAMHPAFSYVAVRLEPAWARWQDTAARFAEVANQASELAASRDMDAIMAFRTQPTFVAFDMASRCIRRLGDMTTWSEPRTDAERAVRSRAFGFWHDMREAEPFTAMRGVSARVQELQGQGLLARDHQFLRLRQQCLQHEYSSEFERRFA